MADYDFDIPVSFRHRIRFTKDAFAKGNTVVADLLEAKRERKVLVFMESEVARLFPQLLNQITDYIEGLEISDSAVADSEHDTAEAFFEHEIKRKARVSKMFENV